jgi:hypothetical protein
MSGPLAAAARTRRAIGDTAEETSLTSSPQLRMIALGSVSRSRIASERYKAGTGSRPSRPHWWMARTSPGLPRNAL